MFLEAESFNQDISSWNVSNVTNMAYMFYHADALSDENKCAIHFSFLSNTNWTYDWFEFCDFAAITQDNIQEAVDLWVSNNGTALETYGPISNWDVSLITDMSELFKDKATFNDDISNWDVSNVTTMGRMFQECRAFKSIF